MGFVVRILWVVGAFSLLLLSGCGSMPVTTGTTATTVSDANLNGNWLLAGTLPFSGPVGPVVNSSLGIAVTFSVVGNQIVGAVTTNIPCGVSSISGAGGVLTGSIAADGTFSAQTTGTATASIQITGTVPTSSGGSWSGTYSITTNNAPCSLSQSGNFVAVHLGDLTGTFKGSAVLTLAGGTGTVTNAPGNVTIVLQQGATLAGTNSFDTELLSGTIQVQGVSCFSTGAATANATSGVLGGTFLTTFTMNDGSTLNAVGQIQDKGTDSLVINDILGGGGACGTVLSGPFLMTKQ